MKKLNSANIVKIIAINVRNSMFVMNVEIIILLNKVHVCIVQNISVKNVTILLHV